jgi:hypothetical protein
MSKKSLEFWSLQREIPETLQKSQFMPVLSIREIKPHFSFAKKYIASPRPKGSFYSIFCEKCQSREISWFFRLG